MFGVTEIHSTFFVFNFFLNLRASVQETFFPLEVYPIEMLLTKAYKLSQVLFLQNVFTVSLFLNNLLTKYRKTQTNILANQKISDKIYHMKC